MKIADFFVELGVRGADSAGKALGGVKNGLGEAKNMSLEAKAAIIGTIYALERMMSTSAKMGTELTNFSTATGVSAQYLQKWQYAAQQVGVHAEDVTSSVKGIQDSMVKMLQGGAAPAGMAMFAQHMASIGQPIKKEKLRDMDYMLHALQQFAQSGPADIMKDKLASFGVNENVFAAMRRNAFRPEVENRAPRFSDKELGQLNKVDVAWANLGTKIKMAFGHLTAKFGPSIVKDLDAIIPKVIDLVTAIANLAEQLQILKGLGVVFDWIAKILGHTTSGIKQDSKLISGEYESKREPGKSGRIQMLKDGITNDMDGLLKFIKSIGSEENKPEGARKNEPLPFAPRVSPATSISPTTNIDQTLNLNFQHDGKDAKKTGDSVSKAAKAAYRQIPAQAGGY